LDDTDSPLAKDREIEPSQKKEDDFLCLSRGQFLQDFDQRRVNLEGKSRKERRANKTLDLSEKVDQVCREN